MAGRRQIRSKKQGVRRTLFRLTGVTLILLSVLIWNVPGKAKAQGTARLINGLEFNYKLRNLNRTNPDYNLSHVPTFTAFLWNEDAKYGGINVAADDSAYPIYIRRSLEDLDVILVYTEADRIIVNEPSQMFDSYEFQTIDPLFLRRLDTSNATDFSYMFLGESEITSLDLSSIDTSNAENMKGMFQLCQSMDTIDVSRFNTSKVRDFSSMFNQCPSLTHMDISGFDTSSATDMKSMFFWCTNLASVKLGNFDTSKVENFSSMFHLCSSLESLDLSSFDASSATDVSEMFALCYALSDLRLDRFNTENVTDFHNMFLSCKSLETLDVSALDTSSAVYVGGMFYDLDALRELDIRQFDFSNVTANVWDQQVFDGCESLYSIYTPYITNDTSFERSHFQLYYDDYHEKYADGTYSPETYDAVPAGLSASKHLVREYEEPSPTPTPSAIPTATRTPGPSPTARASATPEPTSSAGPTPTVTPTATASAGATPTATARASATPKTMPTATARKNATPTATTRAAASPSSTPAPSPTATEKKENASSTESTPGFYNPYAVVRDGRNVYDMPKTGDGDAWKILLCVSLFLIGSIMIVSTLRKREGLH